MAASNTSNEHPAIRRASHKRASIGAVNHLAALRVLLSTEDETKQPYPARIRAELPAIISHWLQTPQEKPIFLGNEVGLRWHRVLARYARIAARPPVETPELPQKPTFEVDFGDLPFPPLKNPVFKFIDLFAGIGGFRIALQTLGGKSVFSSEWDRHAKETYLNNYGEVPFGDIRNFTGLDISNEEIGQTIPDHDVLAAGFPCQPFSGAGVSARNSLGQKHGFSCEIQGTLFFDLVRIAKVKKPAVLILENVKNLKSHDGGETFKRIRQTIENDLGYSFNFEIIDSSPLVPQKRKRCYMVCFRDQRKFTFPLITGQPLPLSSILEKNPNPSFTISERLWQGHINRTKRNLDRGAGFTAYVADLNKPANTLVARYYKDGKECLVPQTGKTPRLLTPKECARMQGYPDEFKIHTWNMQAYRQFGNSVAVPVVQRIADAVVAELKGKK